MKRILALSVLTICTSAFVLSAATPRSLTFEDLIKIRRLSDLQLSPRGDLLAFVVTEFDKAANKGNSDIWIVSVDGSGLRRLTSSPQADSSPRWSPVQKPQTAELLVEDGPRLASKLPQERLAADTDSVAPRLADSEPGLLMGTDSELL